MSIDMLRGVAVLSVLLCHLPFSTGIGAGSGSVFSDWVVKVLGRGHCGVDLFLVISGFCIHRGAQNTTFATFWRRRLHRLYPPYFVALVGTLAGLYALGKITHTPPSVSVVDIIVLLLMLQNFNGAAFRIGNGPFWTLALEEQLYLLYFPMLWLRRRFGWVATIAVVVAATIAWRIGIHNYTIGPGRWIEWSLGALASEAATGKVSLPSWFRSYAVGFFVLAVALWTNDDMAYGAAFFVVVNAAVSRESTASAARCLALVGIWSYSLYLTHEPVMVATKAVVVALGGSVAQIVVARLVVPLLAAMVFYRVVESKFMNRPKTTARVQVPSTLPRYDQAHL